jgi:hypothetical protein
MRIVRSGNQEITKSSYLVKVVEMQPMEAIFVLKGDIEIW